MTSPEEADRAVLYAYAQRAASAALLVIDAARAGSEEAKALCAQVKKAAASNPAEYDRLLQKQAVAALFALGALRFEAR